MTAPLLVLGASGMLGHKLVQIAATSLEVHGTVRDAQAELAGLLGLPEDRLHRHTDITSNIDTILDRVRPAAIVNCTGALKPLDGSLDPAEAIAVNALAPHRLAAESRRRGIRFIQISTDCVFSGSRGGYVEDDVMDATDLYGRSKALGEVNHGTSLTIRTSIVGRQLRGSRGLLEWFLAQRGGTVNGFLKMRFSGLTTAALSRAIVTILTAHPALAGRIHVGGDAISKYDLLRIMNETFDAGVTIVPVEGPPIDRTLNSERFAAMAGAAPSWERMLEEAAGDSTPYEAWRQRVS